MAVYETKHCQNPNCGEYGNTHIRGRGGCEGGKRKRGKGEGFVEGKGGETYTKIEKVVLVLLENCILIQSVVYCCSNHVRHSNK